MVCCCYVLPYLEKGSKVRRRGVTTTKWSQCSKGTLTLIASAAGAVAFAYLRSKAGGGPSITTNAPTAPIVEPYSANAKVPH
jgi:hypothetical protein